MKVGQTILLGLFSSFFLSSLASADMLISSHSVQGPQDCAVMEGVWTGIGQVKSDIGLNCPYTGTATIVKGETPGILQVTLDLKSPPVGCPNIVSEVFKGTCKEGVFTVELPHVDLVGQMGAEGKEAHLGGTVSLAWNGFLVSAEAKDIELKKS